jgi:hypothetical protein
MANYPGMGGSSGGSSGDSSGGPGGYGGMGGGNITADFKTPEGAVMSFLNALRAKDPERLRESTALRAATESTGAYRKAFQAILEESLAAEDFDELVKKFEGMQIVNRNEPKSSGRVEVIVGKTGQKGEIFTRKVTVRHEKAGWKVSDIAGQREFDAPIIIRGGGMPRGRGRR